MPINRKQGSVTRLNRSSNRMDADRRSPNGCSLVWISSTRCLACNQAQQMVHSYSPSVLPVSSNFGSLTCWLPSPCDRLSRPPPTAQEASDPDPRCHQPTTCLPFHRAGCTAVRATPDRVPTVHLEVGSTSEASSSTPAASPRLHRRSSPWPPGRLSHRDQKIPPPPHSGVGYAPRPAHIRQI